jgi:phosphatidylglycerol:prolipoprotein diacylglycerol transferase
MTDLLTLAAAASDHIRFEQLGLSKVALDLGFFTVKWYSLAYIAGILLGWWYLNRLLREPGAPMTKAHADDLVFYATLGIILGGRIGYILFYAPELLTSPIRAISLWDGGMSFHGGVIGTSLGIWLCARRNGLNWLRVHDYVACVVPFGLFFGRLANFVNGELWGKPTDVAWGIVFRGTVEAGQLEPARHPSQLYEAGRCCSRWCCGSSSGAPRRATSRASSPASSCSAMACAASSSNSSASPIGSSSGSPMRRACTWASGCACR